MNIWSGPQSVEISGQTVIVPASDEEYRWQHSPESMGGQGETTWEKWISVLGIEIKQSVEADGFEAALRATLERVHESALARQEAAVEFERRVGELHALFEMLGERGSLSISPAETQTLFIETNCRDLGDKRYIEVEDTYVFKAKSMTCNAQLWQVHLWDAPKPGMIGANMITIDLGDRPTQFRVVGVDMRPQTVLD